MADKDHPPATVRSSMKAHLSVTAICRACDRYQLLDLTDLVRRGHEDTPLLELPLRCRCGSRAYTVVVRNVA